MNFLHQLKPNYPSDPANLLCQLLAACNAPWAHVPTLSAAVLIIIDGRLYIWCRGSGQAVCVGAEFADYRLAGPHRSSCDTSHPHIAIYIPVPQVSGKSIFCICLNMLRAVYQ